jgi:anti-anti-sigma factor
VVRERDGFVLRLLQDPPCYPRLGNALREAHLLVANGARRLAIDLSPVREIDGASVGELIRFHQTIQQAGGSLRLTGVHPWLNRMLEVSGILRLVPAEAGLVPPVDRLAAAG